MSIEIVINERDRKGNLTGRKVSKFSEENNGNEIFDFWKQNTRKNKTKKKKRKKSAEKPASKAQAEQYIKKQREKYIEEIRKSEDDSS